MNTLEPKPIQSETNDIYNDSTPNKIKINTDSVTKMSA